MKHLIYKLAHTLVEEVAQANLIHERLTDHTLIERIGDE